MIHLPAVIADQFSIPRSEARRRIALGRVKINGEITTDLDVDLDTLPPGDPVRFELESRPLSDGFAQMLAGQGEIASTYPPHRPSPPDEIPANQHNEAA